ncbi:elongation factor P maturation arginine rhamnosyltransferase EarP [Massilia sp. TSP1-1-2]|uniref:elongation factor P maturation arginine rhamnosyltransferase EarP n=1 Tax=Massilia sp. TSP1-1-2 TaxID=2804649 RepID=UPI003CE7C314
MLSTVHRAPSLALFCKVVDNYGDIGICWRLARQLQREHGVAVTLWVDDLVSFQRLCPQVSAAAGAQQQQLVEAVAVRHWRADDEAFTPADVADIVVEFFGVDLPATYIQAMAACTPRPVWLNLEGLSAEEWVEGCHRLPSMHPRLPLTKHFFFPGFTERTGGLLREAALGQQRRLFQSDPAAIDAFLAQLGVAASERAACKVSLFCYPSAPVAALFNAWEHGAAPLTCLVPEGVAVQAVETFLGAPGSVGAVVRRGALTLRVVPFLPQRDYDKLLWACDINFVRGEDSFVRAQWAARPFIWHIYEQDEALHHVKLRAFLERYACDQAPLQALSLRWNGAHDADAASSASAAWPELWARFDAARLPMARHCERWEERMRTHGDLTANLLAFAAAVQADARQNSGIMPG